jgi:2-iminobutanoate/2-iminopropanoate deaminase
MKVTAVSTDRAPAAIGPYSQGVRAGELLFTSGQIPLDPRSGELVTGDAAAQTRQVMENLRAVLEAGGSSLELVLKTTIYLVDLGDFADVNRAYACFFGDPPPARSTVQVAALPRGARVEIEAIARARPPSE